MPVAPNTPGNPWLVKGILAVLGITAFGAGIWYMSSSMQLASTTQIKWSSTTDPAGTADVGIVRNTTAGVLKVTNGSTAHGAIEVGPDGIATTSTDGVILSNDTASVVGTTVQYSPRIRWRSQAWDTDGSNDYFDFWFESIPTSASTTSSSLVLKSSKNGAAATTCLTITDSASITGYATFTTTNVAISSNALTAGTMTISSGWRVRTTWNRFTWTNAMVTALGAATSGDIIVATLPAKTRVVHAYVVVDTAATNMGAATLALTLGRDAEYDDYVVSSSLLAAANTVYGDAIGEVGGSLTEHIGDLPSWTSTTAVKVRVSTDGAGGKTLADVLTSTGSVYLLTETLP